MLIITYNLVGIELIDSAMGNRRVYSFMIDRCKIERVLNNVRNVKVPCSPDPVSLVLLVHLVIFEVII